MLWRTVLAAGTVCGSLAFCAPAPAAQPGRLDPSFGSGGKVLYQFGAGGSAAASQVSAVARQRDGRLVIGGFATDADGNRQFMVARLRSNGALDPSFGNDGKVIVQLDSGPNPSSEVHALALQADGKIVAGGMTVNRHSGFLLARLTSNGAFDTSFGQGGVVEVPTPGGGPDQVDPSAVNALAIQADGKIVAAGRAGTFGSLVAVARLDSDGVLDPSFGTGGMVASLPGGAPVSGHPITEALGLALQPDGRIVVGGDTTRFRGQTRAFVMRLNGSDGSPDASFGTDGVVAYEPFADGFAGAANGVALQRDGRIVFAGSAVGETDQGFTGTGIVGRLSGLDGAFDASFGAGGTDVFGPFGDMDLRAVALEPKGHIVLGGTLSDNGNNDFLVAQLNGQDGSLDPSFGTGGEVTGQLDQASGSRSSWVTALALEPNRKIVAAGFAGSKLFVLRLTDPAA